MKLAPTIALLAFCTLSPLWAEPTATMQEPTISVQPDTPANRQLADGVQRLNVEEVKAALAAGADADARVTRIHGPIPLAILAAGLSVSDEVAARSIFDMIASRMRDVNNPDDLLTFETPLMAACELDDLPAVEHFVQLGANVNARTKVYEMGGASINGKAHTLHAGGDTALLSWIDNAHISPGQTAIPRVLAYLLQHGADVNVQNGEGETALISAARRGNATLVRELLRRGANPALRDSAGHDALFDAGLSGQSDVVEILTPLVRSTMTLSEAASYGQVNQVKRCLRAGEALDNLNWRGWTPLMCAVTSGSRATVQCLLDHGAPVNGTGRMGSTALQLAAAFGQTDIMRLLIARGADLNSGSVRPAGYRAYPPDTPLLAAVGGSHGDAVELLLAHHVDLGKFNQGQRALESAVRSAGNVGLQINRGTPLLAKRGSDQILDDQWSIIELLLKAGVSPRADHSYIVYEAANNRQSGIVDLLLHYGASVDGRGDQSNGDTDDGTALMAAIETYGMAGAEGHEKHFVEVFHEDPASLRESQAAAMDTIKLLLARHANVNLTDTGLRTPLVICAQYDMPELAGLLLTHGATPDSADWKGFTPLMIAATNADVRLARLLVDHGARVDRRDSFGYTSLMDAVCVPQKFDDYYWPKEGPRGHDYFLDEYRNAKPTSAQRAMVISYLLSVHAAVNVRAADGMTAVDLARKNGFGDIAALLTRGLSTGASYKE